ncbi:MAG: hypothetical protein II753_07330, partial [Spirochaetales bacterium]|nr:hypothetical protein [Spirochaetales bacterium]
TVASFLLCSSRNINSNMIEAIFEPLYGSVKGWNPKSLSDTINSLSEEGSLYPITGVSLQGRGKLLYPSDKFVYNAIASFLRRINDGYKWIVREAGRLRQRAFRSRGKKIQKP